jgi:hypothetical protein
MKRLIAWLSAGVLGATVLVVGGLALASPGSSDATVEACYHNRTGALRVDLSGAGCGAVESPVTLGGAGLVTRTVVADRVLPDDGFGALIAECGHGEVVLGGGFEIASVGPETAIITNAPHTLDDGRQGWLVSMSAGGPAEIWSFAICAPGVSG